MTAPGPVAALIAEHCRELLGDPEQADDTTLRDIVAQCGQPLRVLLVGDVSSGKSTLLNALVSGSHAETAFKETTSKVTWYHGPHLGTLRLPDPSHRAVAVEFPLADRLVLGDSPGLNTPSENPRETLRMMGGGDLAGAAAAFVCVLDNGLVSGRWAKQLEGLAALSAGPFDLVGNLVLVMAKIDLIDDDIGSIERRTRDATPLTFRFAGVNQLMAAAVRTGAVDRRTVAVLDALRALPSFASWPPDSWPEVWDELSGPFSDADLTAFKDSVGAPEWLPELVRTTADMDHPSAVAAVFERMSGLATLESVLADIAEDADLFTSTAVLLRLRRLAAGLPDAPAARVRSAIAGVTSSRPYQDLWPRAAARLMRHTSVGDGLGPDDLDTALRLLRGLSCPPADAATALTRWSARAADPFADSRTRHLARLVQDAALRVLAEPESEATL
ncbi:GTPase [Streptomyces sp. NPDC058525]|uniref:GTPase n=1 Tax=Streptomyces sp. NPDC058525 TaxID=3346538 RepID=UPI00364B5282